MTFLKKKDENWRWLFWKKQKDEDDFFEKQKDDRWKIKNKKMTDGKAKTERWRSLREKKSQRVRSRNFCLGAWTFDWKLHFSAFRCESNTWIVSKKWHLRVLKPSKNNWEKRKSSLSTLIWRKLFLGGGENWLLKTKQEGKKQSNDSYPPTHKYLGERHFTKKFLCDECNWLRKLHGTFMLENSRSLIGARQISKMLTLVI